MLGWPARSLIFRRSVPVTRPHVKENCLINSFQKLTISTEAPKPITRPRQPTTSFHWLYKHQILKRHFGSRSFKNSRTRGTDYHHLDLQGRINEEILETRKAFLLKHGLLMDCFEFEGRLVYANRHLYDIHQLDRHGQTNLMRMKLGMCPISRQNEDLVVVHHFDQTDESPWVVLLDSFHMQNYKQLHSNISLAMRVDRTLFNRMRRRYWAFEAMRYLEAQNSASISPKGR